MAELDDFVSGLSPMAVFVRVAYAHSAKDDG